MTPKGIRTKPVKKDIKALDKTANIGQRMKNAFIRSKNAAQSADYAAENSQRTAHDNPSSYATDKMSGGAQTVTREGTHRLKNPRKKAAENFNRAKEQFKRARQQLPRARKKAAEQAKQTAATAKNTADTLKNKAEQAQKVSQNAQKSVSDAKRVLQQTRMAGRQAVQTAKQAVKTGKQAEKTIKTAGKTAKATGKGTIKTVKQSVKTAERTAKTTVKTAQKTAKAARQSAKAAAKAAKIAAQASRAAAKAAVQTAKTAVKVTIAMVKAAIAAIRGLVALIAAGGWIAVLVILVICMIGLLVGSIFGIFFSGEDSGNGYTMPMAIAEINQEYADRLTEIRNTNAHDDVQMSGTRAPWKEVLAVYAVKTSTDPENAQDVATMDESKKALLSSVFWDMNVITRRTETKEVTEVTVEGDGEDFITTETTVTKTILYITVTHKTADEMAEQYGFSEQQKAQLAELLSDQYADLWSAVLYGIHNGSEDIVAAAISQIGNVNGEPYWNWYGFESRVAWCACFVSWCANECGYIESGVIPLFAWCPAGVQWFKDRDIWQAPGYVPAPGDIIFFDWEQDGATDHVGIVEYVEGEYVHTVEGNTSNSVARREYRLDSGVIFGFGTPLYG
jgi:hypothetical protein